MRLFSQVVFSVRRHKRNVSLNILYFGTTICNNVNNEQQIGHKMQRTILRHP